MQMGGAKQLVDANTVWTQSHPGADLKSMVNFLVGHEGLDFHSDDENVTDERTQTTQQRQMQHTFRTQLAADIVHAMDQAPVQLPLSSAAGVALSMRMAEGLSKRQDVALLVRKDLVEEVLSRKKRKLEDNV
jgi:hypothetical protein